MVVPLLVTNGTQYDQNGTTQYGHLLASDTAHIRNETAGLQWVFFMGKSHQSQRDRL